MGNDVAIQDRSFNTDGSLFYPATRAFFDEIAGPYRPDTDIAPIWNPEFFGNMIMVNGNTWPFQTVEQRRYRFRFLNGCNSRFLILDFSLFPGVEVWQIFEVVNRQNIVVFEDQKQVQIDSASPPTPPERGETGFKDTVIAYPGQVTRVRAQFNTARQFVWHCHIVEHEDNEMMRPYRIGPVQQGQPR